MMRTARLIAFLLCLTPLAQAQRAVKGRIILTSGQKRDGYLVANDDGSIKLSKRPDGSGISQTVRRSSIRQILTAKPGVIGKMEKALDEKRYDDVIQQAGSVPKVAKWLGWGGYTHYLVGQAQLAKKAYPQARAAAREGLRYAGAEGRSGLLQQLLFAVDVAENPNKPGIADKLLRARPSPGKYKMLGIIAETKARSKNNDRQLLMEAAIHYMKVVLVYTKEDLEKDPAGTADRKEAYARLIEVLKLLNDKSKAEQFAALRKQDYGR